MKKTKIIIEVRNGTVDLAFGNVDFEYVIINYDDMKKERFAASTPQVSTATDDPLYQCYQTDDPIQQEVGEILRRMNF